MRKWIDELEARTKAFAVSSIELARELEASGAVPRTVIWQFVDSATSVGANHRACRHARSDREFAAKIGIAVEEADESAFWLELITEVGRPVPIAVRGLREEAAALRAILSRSAATIRKRIKEARSSGTPYPRPK